jgi:hypothetical protein
VLARIADHLAWRIAELLAWNWQPLDTTRAGPLTEKLWGGVDGDIADDGAVTNGVGLGQGG